MMKCYKEAYQTMADAHKVADSIKGRRDGNGFPAKAYHCTECGKYHVTGRKQSKTQRTRNTMMTDSKRLENLRKKDGERIRDEAKEWCSKMGPEPKKNRIRKMR